jgi:putative endonuclease
VQALWGWSEFFIIIKLGNKSRSALSLPKGYELMWYVYIILCSDGSFYTGSSSSPDVRFSDHKNGKGGRYTRLHKPIKRLYLEKLSSKSDALKRESQIKGWSRAKKIKILKLEI